MTTTASFSVTELDLEAVSAEFETAPASAIVRWAVDTFGTRMCLTASMQDAVLIDVATKVDPNIEVVFIDTGYHFPETLQTVKVVQERYDLNLRVMRIPQSDPPLWESDPENCCASAKVAQLDAALVGKLAWMSGLRRDEAETRADTPIVGRDSRGLIKVNPLAGWTELDVAGYIADHDVPINPLLEQGYPSIGCMPCTRPVADGEHPRAGRWAGLDKTECGIHL
jgi:phosphoadenosine phosphosulfate reductase